MPRLIFNAKTLKLCSKIKFATQAQQTAPSSIRCRIFSVVSELGSQKRKWSCLNGMSVLPPRTGHRQATPTYPFRAQKATSTAHHAIADTNLPLVRNS